MFISAETQQAVLKSFWENRLRIVEDGTIEQRSTRHNAWSKVTVYQPAGSPHTYVQILAGNGKRVAVRETYVRMIWDRKGVLDPSELPSHKEKIQETIRKKRASYNCVLSDDAVTMIRWRYHNEGWSIKALSDAYPVTSAHIRNIIAGRVRVTE